MRMYVRTREIDPDSIRKWGRFFTEWGRAEEVGAIPVVYRDMRRVVYRILGIRMGKRMMQLPMEWRDRLRSAGLDAEWNVVDEVLWRHAVWQVETTGVFRPERQEGLKELLGTEEGEVSQRIPPPRGKKPDLRQNDGEKQLSETLNRLLKR